MPVLIKLALLYIALFAFVQLGTAQTPVRKNFIAPTTYANAVAMAVRNGDELWVAYDAHLSELNDNMIYRYKDGNGDLVSKPEMGWPSLNLPIGNSAKSNAPIAIRSLLHSSDGRSFVAGRSVLAFDNGSQRWSSVKDARQDSSRDVYYYGLVETTSRAVYLFRTATLYRVIGPGGREYLGSSTALLRVANDTLIEIAQLARTSAERLQIATTGAAVQGDCIFVSKGSEMDSVEVQQLTFRLLTPRVQVYCRGRVNDFILPARVKERFWNTYVVDMSTYDNQLYLLFDVIGFPAPLDLRAQRGIARINLDDTNDVSTFVFPPVHNCSNPIALHVSQGGVYVTTNCSVLAPRVPMPLLYTTSPLSDTLQMCKLVMPWEPDGTGSQLLFVRSLTTFKDSLVTGSFPPIFIPLRSLRQFSDVLSVDTENSHAVDIDVYPNPTASDFHFAVPGRDVTDVSRVLVIDSDGAMVGAYRSLAENRIDVSSLSSGVYRALFFSGDALIGSAPLTIVR